MKYLYEQWLKDILLDPILDFECFAIRRKETNKDTLLNPKPYMLLA